MKGKTAKNILVIALIILSVFLVIIGYVLYCGWAFFVYDPSCEIKKGFTPELVDEMREEFGITVPKESKFIKGYNSWHPQDSQVIVIFEVPHKDFDKTKIKDSVYVTHYVRQLLSLDLTKYGELGGNTFVYSDLIEEYGGEMQFCIVNKSRSYTNISFSFELDKTIVRLEGWRPSRMFE